MSEQKDPTSPDYYRLGGVQVIQISRHLTSNLGQAVQYLCRAGKKDPTKTVEDIRKAIWFAEDELQRLTGEGGHAK